MNRAIAFFMLVRRTVYVKGAVLGLAKSTGIHD